MSAYERRKGHNYEREIVLKLKAAGYDCRRNLQPQGGRQVGNDLSGLPWGVECMRRRSIRWSVLKGKLDQARRDAHGKTPIVVHRADRDQDYVLLTLEDFLALTSQARLADHDPQPHAGAVRAAGLQDA